MGMVKSCEPFKFWWAQPYPWNGRQTLDRQSLTTIHRVEL